ncbi:hypothetical protein E2C01_077190 [Portunus trituberculatus]|uniref:Uncharacterized protein n=1 Tax=Portunus trituberculatus TaxID=210409 RepID=A0A5B7IL65_PORTR|nr:hypothetical protein [Portunus trituberculatus]
MTAVTVDTYGQPGERPSNSNGACLPSKGPKLSETGATAHQTRDPARESSLSRVLSLHCALVWLVLVYPATGYNALSGHTGCVAHSAGTRGVSRTRRAQGVCRALGGHTGCVAHSADTPGCVAHSAGTRGVSRTRRTHQGVSRTRRAHGVCRALRGHTSRVSRTRRAHGVCRALAGRTGCVAHSAGARGVSRTRHAQEPPLACP